MLAISLLMVLYRVLKGPTVPDRVASLDVAAVIVMATIGVLCVRTDDSSYLDVAVVLAIIVFLSTVAFGRYLERRARQ
ncbi:monovalent cation/H+ antiporter complex subunit F [Geitlerinema splendidum]|nr:monovalent cation/H+ antiporter complex subunit F [Geitlerinema splendidum]